MMLSTTPETIEGTWEEISRQASKLNGHRLRVTILPDQPEKSVPGKMITRGMFPQLADIIEADFKEAEFHGDSDDGLDWSA